VKDYLLLSSIPVFVTVRYFETATKSSNMKLTDATEMNFNEDIYEAMM
jgi:hypothetical protein